MNIKVGDIVQMKNRTRGKSTRIQGAVTRIVFTCYAAFGPVHMVEYHSGYGYVVYSEPQRLKVIRRFK